VNSNIEFEPRRKKEFAFDPGMKIYELIDCIMKFELHMMGKKYGGFDCN